MIESGGNIIMN